MSEIFVLAADTSRAKCYIQNLVHLNVKIARVLLLRNLRELLPEQSEIDRLYIGKTNQHSLWELSGFKSKFDSKEAVDVTANKHNIPVSVLDTTDVNSPLVLDMLNHYTPEIVIFCGPGGMILRSDVLNACGKILHVHPGALPRMKGSTTMYYSILLDGYLSASLIVMDRGIDTGPICHHITRPIPRQIDPHQFDCVLDPILRADCLIDYFLNDTKASAGAPGVGLSSNNDELKSRRDPPFFIIHPVLKHKAILKAVNSHEVFDES